ncbi:hypothetical protein ALC62_03426 [Cyphomyrmex costatus]|uniref:Uncharacterized protein n=1 Tax=Cyphomyrmex costatus TaxID=456900 RepID=A0A195CYA3_9HYME|nr:hypothetical protein ALC62_03426 [Cyphomyrmex costatus]
MRSSYGFLALQSEGASRDMRRRLSFLTLLHVSREARISRRGEFLNEDQVLRATRCLEARSRTHYMTTNEIQRNYSQGCLPRKTLVNVTRSGERTNVSDREHKIDDESVPLYPPRTVLHSLEISLVKQEEKQQT